MKENVITMRLKDSVGQFSDMLENFSLRPQRIESFKNGLSKAIEELPYEEKIVLALYHCEELTVAEIGEILRKTERAIYQVYLNAISNLRSKIQFFV